jgi:hypothetical protein
MAGGNDYRDMGAAIEILDQGAITLSTTQKALWAASKTLIPASDFKVGRTWKLTAGLKLVTDGTAGNYVFGAGIGTGDAPAVIVIGPTVAGTVSQTLMAVMEAYMTVRALGASGTVSIWGEIRASVGILASTLQPYIFPSAGGTVVSTLDMTLNTGAFTFQAQRSGAGVWTATCVGVPLLERLN